MASETNTTADHDEIRRWVEEHDGRPSRVRGTEDDGGGTGVLRIDFPGGGRHEPDRAQGSRAGIGAIPRARPATPTVRA